MSCCKTKEKQKNTREVRVVSLNCSSERSHNQKNNPSLSFVPIHCIIALIQTTRFLRVPIASLSLHSKLPSTKALGDRTLIAYPVRRKFRRKMVGCWTVERMDSIDVFVFVRTWTIKSYFEISSKTRLRKKRPPKTPNLWRGWLLRILGVFFSSLGISETLRISNVKF